MSNSTKYVFGAVMFLTLGACATSQPALQGQLSPDLGSATHANIAAHAVAPTARQKADTFIPANAARTALAREKYETADVPETTKSGY